MSGVDAASGMPLVGVLARWDALAIRWGLDGEERSTLLGRVGTGPVEDPSTYDAGVAEDRMRLLVAFGSVLESVHRDEAFTRAWLRRPNLQLRGGTPLENMSQSPEWIRWLISAVGAAS